MSGKVGLATGRNLPELCRERFPRPVTRGLWVQAELPSPVWTVRRSWAGSCPASRAWTASCWRSTTTAAAWVVAALVIALNAFLLVGLLL